MHTQPSVEKSELEPSRFYFILYTEHVARLTFPHSTHSLSSLFKNIHSSLLSWNTPQSSHDLIQALSSHSILSHIHCLPPFVDLLSTHNTVSLPYSPNYLCLHQAKVEVTLKPHIRFPLLKALWEHIHISFIELRTHNLVWVLVKSTCMCLWVCVYICACMYLAIRNLIKIPESQHTWYSENFCVQKKNEKKESSGLITALFLNHKNRKTKKSAINS